MRWLLSSALFAVLTMSSAAAVADESAQCRESANHAARIAACSSLIKQNPNDSAAHYHRGLAYQLTGETDLAILDFQTVIELNPYHPAAYESRGRAYAAKGDYVRAVADVTKASELTKSGAADAKKTT